MIQKYQDGAMKLTILPLLLLLSQSFFAGSVSVSGISSGGFMAGQMATIFSDEISAVGAVAGGVCSDKPSQSDCREERCPCALGRSGAFLY